MQLTKKNIRLILGAVLATLLVVILIQNSHGVTLSFIAGRIQLPLFVIVLGAALIGFAIGWLVKARR